MLKLDDEKSKGAQSSCDDLEIEISFAESIRSQQWEGRDAPWIEFVAVLSNRMEHETEDGP